MSKLAWESGDQSDKLVSKFITFPQEGDTCIVVVDGRVLITSIVQKVELHEGEVVVTTRNRNYIYRKEN